MKPQYLGQSAVYRQAPERIDPAPSVRHLFLYLFKPACVNLSSGCASASAMQRVRQAGRARPVRSIETNRSRGCPGTSNCLRLSRLWPAWPPVRVHRKKNMSWSTQSRSASSRSIQASTSNTLSGRAFGPVPRLSFRQGGASKHFQKKWEPVFRPEMRQKKIIERFHGSGNHGGTL